MATVNATLSARLSVSLTGTKASHGKTFTPGLDAVFSMSDEEYIRFRMAVGDWMKATGEYSNIEIEYVTWDAQTVPRPSPKPALPLVLDTHPVPRQSVRWTPTIYDSLGLQMR